MRVLMTCVLVTMTLGSGAPADEPKVEKIDAAKLVGRWEAKGTKSELVIEFAKDGKTKSAFTSFGQSIKVMGTYTLEGNKIHTVAKHDDAEVKATVTVTKLTDTELVWIKENGRTEVKLTRAKDK